MHKSIKYIWLSILVLILILIRFYEDVLFYDPYLTFFKNDYLYIDSPRQEIAKLVSFTILRFVLNTIISLAILNVVFKDKSIIKFSLLIYAIAFMVFMILYLYFVVNPRQEDYYMFFNIRRFLIQPILLILLIPAFYYNNLKS